MFLAQITFGSDSGERCHRDMLSDAAESYLAMLLKNGQIYGEYLLAWSNHNLTVYVKVARPDALDRHHHSAWAVSDLNRVVELFGQSPECHIIDDEIPKQFSPWQQSTSFYLFTHAFDATSPVCCGDTGLPIPLYLLPISQHTREQLYFWARSYTYHDNIWLGSAALEIPAYQQLADPSSDLSVRGRALCAEVEQATEIPTFYFMNRYWGRQVGEAARVCPLCGSQWHQPPDPQGWEPFYRFPFRCQPCRLVSRHADSDDDDRYAHIGEFNVDR